MQRLKDVENVFLSLNIKASLREEQGTHLNPLRDFIGASLCRLNKY